MTRPFTVAMTADFFSPAGEAMYDVVQLDRLNTDPAVAWQPFAEHRHEITSDQLAGANAVLVLAPAVTARSLARPDDLLAVVRFGVGYDAVDVPACTAGDVAVVIATGATSRSVAEATLTWMLALGHRLLPKDRLVRQARWHERAGLMGSELRDRRLGLIGFGGIGRKLVELLRPFGMQEPLVYDPLITPESCRQAGVCSVPLETLLSDADFVSLHCPLNDQTRGLIGQRELALMKPTAYFINTARGGIVDEQALFVALSAQRLAGAALDCFEGEPLTAAPRFAELDNVILAPHCIAWTHELFRDIGQTTQRAIVDLAYGRRPSGVVNAEVFERPSFQAKWQRLRHAGAENLSAR